MGDFVSLKGRMRMRMTGAVFLQWGILRTAEDDSQSWLKTEQGQSRLKAKPRERRSVSKSESEAKNVQKYPGRCTPVQARSSETGERRSEWFCFGP